MRVLLIEDDQLVGDGIKLGLSKKSFSIDWVEEADTALAALKSDNFDAIILDLGLPKMSGFEFLELIRKKKNQIPVLILTARNLTDDKIKGLDIGADDYLAKPFSLAELAARLRAITRRNQERSASYLQRGKLIIYPESLKVCHGNLEVDIKGKEYKVLLCLMEHPQKIFSREELESTLYGWNEGVESNSVEVHIHSLRKKLGKNSIKTIRGSGYRLGDDL